LKSKYLESSVLNHIIVSNPKAIAGFKHPPEWTENYLEKKRAAVIVRRI